jgi:arylsulfatase A-like enzyme
MFLPRNKKLAFWLLLLAVLPGCKAIERPNILWINADDLGVELGCYGNPDVKTPNMDRLASQGVRYTNAYATSPVCSPSRSSMITGMYPPSINCQDHRTIDMTELPEGIRPITAYFKEAGYFCTNGNSLDMSKPGKEDYNFKSGNLFDGTDWAQRKTGQPFFVQVQIYIPHRPFVHDPDNPVNPDHVHLPACYPDHPLLRADWAMYLESIQQCDKIVGKILSQLDEEGLAENTIVILFGDNGRPHLRDKQFLYEGGLKVPLIVRWPGKFKQGKLDDQLVSLIDVSATSMALAKISIPGYMQGNVFIGEQATKRKYIFGFRQRMGDAVDDSRSISDGRYKLIWNRMPEIPWMQMSGYKKLEYPAYSLYRSLHLQGKLAQPFDRFMSTQKPEIELYDLKADPMEFDNLDNDQKYTEIKQKLFTILVDSLKQFEKNMIMEKSETIQKAKESSASYYQAGMKKIGLSDQSTDEEILKYWEKILIR